METMAADNESMLGNATKNFADVVTLQSRSDDIALLFKNYPLDLTLAEADT